MAGKITPYRRDHRSAKTASVVVGLLALGLALALGAVPAGAIVARIGGHGYGITPLRGVNPTSIAGAYRPSSRARAVRPFDEPPFGGTQLEYHGGPVMHSNTTHVIYWDPEKAFTATTMGVIEGFFTDVEHDSGLPTNVFAVDAQYTDSSGGNAAYKSTFAGALTDTEEYPPSGCTAPTAFDKGPPYTNCLTDEQLQSELSAFIGREGLLKGPSQLYFLLLPHQVVTCFPKEECSSNVFCAYHSYINPGTAGEIIYADIPFSLLDSEGPAEFVDAKGCQADLNEAIQTPNGDTAGTNASTRYADVALKYISHEYSEAITDPLVNFDTAWVDPEGFENGDKCNSVPYTAAEEGAPGFDKHAFTPPLGGEANAGTLFNQAIDGGHFYLQSEWDNVASACLMQPLPVSAAAFTGSPASAVVHAPVTFEGTASDPYGELELNWAFGDGATGAGAAPTHSYANPGSYEVTMTPTDRLTGSTSAPVVHTVVVNDLPTASFAFAPNGAPTGTAIAFDGSASADLDGTIAGYAWSFGDGTLGSGATVSHAFAAPGQYAVTLTVTDSAGETNSTSQQVTVAAPSGGSTGSTGSTTTTTTTTTSSTGRTGSTATTGPSALAVGFNVNTGAITLALSLAEPGTLSWLGTFQNGKFGVFTARAAKCRRGRVRLGGRCLAARIVFARGSRSVAGAGRLTIVLRPSAAAAKALKNALKHRTGVPVSLTLTFQPARGGSAVVNTRTVLARLKKR